VSAPWRVLIVDDEPLARGVVRGLLTEAGGFEVVAEAATGHQAIAAIADARCDLMFLDVQMPDLDGLRVLEAVPPDRRPLTVFVTAWEEHAVRAFEEEALDYLVKPFSDARFHRVVERARRQLHQPGPAYLERVLASSGRRTCVVEMATVRWIEADDYYARLHTADAAYLIRTSMRELERSLDPRRFVRVHRGAIVRTTAMRWLRADGGGRYSVELEDGRRVAVSARRLRQVRRQLAEGGAPVGSPARG
jgi:two-component system, LytTR family, response regulator